MGFFDIGTSLIERKGQATEEMEDCRRLLVHLTREIL
jgi:hypothetical protein